MEIIRGKNMVEIKNEKFEVVKTYEIEDCDGQLVEMVHKKTGAKLAWLDRKEENKTFAITFKTIPSDDTGVFHILEHSVLNGSKKYPVKEPFVNLLKTSLKTFLNAMTFPDKTMYPVSSRNQKDFLNLMSVYLDAVFNPLVMENPKIFAQEGWHYEIRDLNDVPQYKGVVFNEMKGAYASVDETIINEVCNSLFPDNCYQYSYGGDPEVIPTLTYEQFKNAHDTFYHPSNSGIFLDGEMDIEEALKMIDSYLDAFDRQEFNFDIPYQEEKQPTVRDAYYEIGEEEDEKERTQYVMTKIFGDYKDVENNIAISVLSNVISGNNEAPLKKAIIDNGLGQDVDLLLLDGIQQPALIYAIRNTEKENIEKIKEVTREVVEKLVSGELKHSQLQATLNNYEFNYREKKEPSGLIFANNMWMSWLYDEDPTLYMNMGKYYGILKNKVEQGYFEELLKELFLDKPFSEITILPSKTFGKEKNKKEEERLKVINDGWTKEEKQAHIKFNEELDIWQAIPNSKEDVAKIPMISIEDIDKEPRKFELEERELGSSTLLLHPREDSGIVYWNLYFSLAGLRKEELSTVSLFTKLLMKVPTKKHTVEELSELIKANLGFIAFSTDTLPVDGRNDVAQPLLSVSLSMLEGKQEVAKDIVKEILEESVFTKEVVTPVIQQFVEMMRQMLIEAGNAVGIMRAGTHKGSVAVAKEYTSGYTYSKFQSSLLEDEAKLEQFLQDTQSIMDTFITKERVTFSVTGEDSIPVVEDLVNSFNSLDFHKGPVHYKPIETDLKEGIVIPSQVSYSGLVANINEAGLDYEGALNVVSQIATYDYLWNEVRVKGGAYGTNFNINRNGLVTCSSYRDPDLKNALNAYRSVANIFKNANWSDEELTGFIIGTISNTDPLMPPLVKVAVADSYHLQGITYEDRVEARKGILSTTNQDLQRIGEFLEKAIDDASLCLVGSKESIDKSGEEVKILE